MARTSPAPAPETADTADTAKESPVAPESATAPDLDKPDPSTANELPQSPVLLDSPAEPEPTSAPQAKQEPLDQSGMLTLYPLRSYLDGKDIKRAGGEGYQSPKHDAALLIAKGLATLTDPRG